MRARTRRRGETGGGGDDDDELARDSARAAAAERARRGLEAAQRRRRRLAYRAGWCFAEALRILWREWGAVALCPVRTRREWGDWVVTVAPHRDGRRVTLRFRADTSAYVLRVRDILNQSVRILFYGPRAVDRVFLPVVFREREDIVVTNALTGSVPALPEAATSLKTSRRFVARLLGDLAARGVDPTHEWRSAPRRMRESPRFALRLVRRHRCPLAAIAAGAAPRARAFLLLYTAMVPLALCAQRAGLRLGDVWSAVGRYIGEEFFLSANCRELRRAHARLKELKRKNASLRRQIGQLEQNRSRDWRRRVAHAIRFARSTIALRRL